MKNIVLCFLFICVTLPFGACAYKNEGKVIAIEEIGGVVLTDDFVDLPDIKVVYKNGEVKETDYASFWFVSENVFVQDGKVFTKAVAPTVFTDTIAVILKTDKTIKQVIEVEKPFIPLQSVEINSEKDYCLVGESLGVDISVLPANASNKNVILATDCADTKIENGILSLPQDFPENTPITLTATVNSVVYGTKTIQSKKRTEIATADGIADIANNSVGDYAIVADIYDFSGTGNRFPIPEFHGTLKGNGHTISGFALTIPSQSYATEQNIGLFGKLFGEITDLGFVAATIKCGKYQGGANVNIGVLAGKTINATIRNVSVSGTLHCERYLSKIGGIIGYMGGGVMENCAASVDILGSGDTGGIIGYAQNTMIKNVIVSNGQIGVSLIAVNKSVGGIAGVAAETTIDNAGVDNFNIEIVSVESILPTQANPIIGILVGTLSASVITGLNATQSISDCYGTNINNSVVLTNQTVSSVHVYDGDSIRSDGNRYGGHHHTAEYSVGLDIDKLKERGYKTIKITMSFEIRAENIGDGRRIWLDLDRKGVFWQNNLNVNKTTWYKVTYTTSVSIEEIKTTTKFRIGFETRSYAFSNAVWWFNTADIRFEAVK